MEYIVKKVVEIKNLQYTYPDGKLVLKDINLDIFEGESVGIIGHNGAGKTTLLLHLNGILRENGEINILGMPLNEKNLKTIRSKVGMVFQNPDDQLFSPTVFDDVSFGPLNMKLSPEEVKERTKKALNDVEMSEFEDHSPHHLSFGEKKRISIATVFSMEPEILVLDEPTSNLSPQLRRKLIAFLKNIESTKIIASHDLEMISELCKTVILLNEGTIVKTGKTMDIMKDENLMEQNGLL